MNVWVPKVVFYCRCSKITLLHGVGYMRLFKYALNSKGCGGGVVG